MAPRSPVPPASASGSECRCACGSLVARLVGGGVELKCRRCKRTLVVPLTSEAAPAASPIPSPVALREAG